MFFKKKSIPKQKIVGLALGSGSSRGWAHIGVINALEEHHIPIDYVAGTSVGGYVGAVYAAGDIKRLEQFARSMDRKTVLSHMDISFPTSGFFDGKHIPDLIYSCTEARTFEDLKIPCSMVATDMYSGKEVIFKEGSLGFAIRASGSVPGILTPVKYEHTLLIDGGVVNPVPVNVVKEMGAEFIIAVDLNSDIIARKKQSHPKPKSEGFKIGHRYLEKIKSQMSLPELSIIKKINDWLENDEVMPSILEVFGSTIDLMEYKITKTNMELTPPDILIEPKLKDMKMFDFHQADQAIKEGYTQTMTYIPKIKEMLGIEDLKK